MTYIRCANLYQHACHDDFSDIVCDLPINHDGEHQDHKFEDRGEILCWENTERKPTMSGFMAYRYDYTSCAGPFNDSRGAHDFIATTSNPGDWYVGSTDEFESWKEGLAM